MLINLIWFIYQGGKTLYECLHLREHLAVAYLYTLIWLIRGAHMGRNKSKTFNISRCMTVYLTLKHCLNNKLRPGTGFSMHVMFLDDNKR